MSKLLSAKGAPLEPVWGAVGLGINDAKLLVDQEGEAFVAALKQRFNQIEKARLNLDEFMEILGLIEAFLGE